jgi:hypothetical protein
MTGGPRDAGERSTGTAPSIDLLGAEMTPSEERLLAVYEELKALCSEELPPIAHANVRAALALMHNVVNGLALRYEHLSDLGV